MARKVDYSEPHETGAFVPSHFVIHGALEWVRGTLKVPTVEEVPRQRVVWYPIKEDGER